MSNLDRQLSELIKELTEYGMVWRLSGVLDEWGRERAERVVADGFAVIRHEGADLGDEKFLAEDDAVVVITTCGSETITSSSRGLGGRSTPRTSQT